jgi:dolichol-phosphate mannosyltransferase
MSGVFALRRQVFTDIAGQLNPRGFKILLELVHRTQLRTVAEVPFVFRPRTQCHSKMGAGVAFDFLAALWDLRFGRVLPLSFLRYALVGLSGVGVTEGVLWLLHYQTGWDKDPALAAAIGTAMVTNFLLNNAWTFRRTSRRGTAGLLTGLAIFAAICSVGALINFSVSRMVDLLLEAHTGRTDLLWLAAFAGIIMATVWNYSFSKRLVWRE